MRRSVRQAPGRPPRQIEVDAVQGDRGGSSSRGTSSGTIACHAGALSAEPIPSMKVSEQLTMRWSSPGGSLIRARPPRPASTPARQSGDGGYRRYPLMHLRAAPEGRSAGSPRPGSGHHQRRFDNDVISHAAPTFCIQVPRLEASAAIHSARKTSRRSGAQDDDGAAATHLVMTWSSARSAKGKKT